VHAVVLYPEKHHHGVLGQRGPVPEDPEAAGGEEAGGGGGDLVDLHPDRAGAGGAALDEDPAPRHQVGERVPAPGRRGEAGRHEREQGGQERLGANSGLLSTQTGTPYYASPEVWKDQAYDSKSDIWSLGCVLYEMCALKPPFRGEDMEDLFKKVTKGFSINLF